MQKIISKGKTIDDAVRTGLHTLNVKKQDVHIEIIQPETNGFFGIGKKNAVVKLTYQNKSAEIKQMDQIAGWMNTLHGSSEKTQDGMEIPGEHSTIQKEKTYKGKAWVKNGQLQVNNSPFHFPTVKIGKGIEISRNGSNVKDHHAILSELDDIQVIFEESSETKTEWRITVSSNNLRVMLEVKPGYRIKRHLKDHDPAEHIELTLEEIKMVENHLSVQDILMRLEELNIHYGWKQDVIMKAVNTTKQGTFEIAAGRDAVAGMDGWLELTVDTDTKNSLTEDENGDIDFRDSTLIPTVKEGDVIGMIHPPLPGRTGISVTNEPVQPKPVKPVQVKTGKGIIEVDQRLVATEAGRPFVEKRGNFVKAYVAPKLVHRANVDLSSGNIHFNGDVEVVGQVEDHMLVEAGGDIYIHENVHNANVTTTNSIVLFGTATGSNLSAGKNNMIIAELGHILGKLNPQMNKMIRAIQQLKNIPAFRTYDTESSGIQPLIHLLLENRFKNFSSLIHKYRTVVQNGGEYLDHQEWKTISRSLHQIFLSLSNKVIGMEQLWTLSKKMKELHEFTQTPVEPDAYITLSDASNSSLYCSGNINLLGKGCVNTKIHAGGKLFVTGAVRGGHVYGGLGAKLNETGSESGTKTIISVPFDQRIQIKDAKVGTVLKIGTFTHVLQEDSKNIDACLYEDEIMFA
ncbi:FapA family protein [Virgibacillus sp. MSP4-1]|uniref:flagellar assembly protein A n=1 Tax=Virgibacillus sp. MSP4-1 TaxID=2700081 RepID=UPI0003AACDB8|nr:FapA family protein [Virgibacillus sp. MSP4-1]QHS21924.1 FapA family protein [Virgibacillus sp. MSP4-1]